MPASGSSLWSQVEALYSRAGERMREALHAGVKKALAVVSSHYAGINLPAVCEGYVLPDDEVEAQEEVQRLEDAATAPGDALAAFFDAEVELPPLGAQGLFYIPCVFEDLPCFIGELVGAGSEDFGDDEGSFLGGCELVTTLVVLPEPQHQVADLKSSASDSSCMVSAEGLLVLGSV